MYNPILGITLLCSFMMTLHIGLLHLSPPLKSLHNKRTRLKPSNLLTVPQVR